MTDEELIEKFLYLYWEKVKGLYGTGYIREVHDELHNLLKEVDLEDEWNRIPFGTESQILLKGIKIYPTFKTKLEQIMFQML